MKTLARWLAPAALLAAVLILYAPALGFELTGDDYQWVQLAHRATHQPRALLSDLDSFYRPASTWTLVLDRLAWRHDPSGYHLTNLLLHALAAALLAAAARRLRVAETAAWAIALLWACSPFTLEPAAAVAIRFEDLLLIAWLGLILAWPTMDAPWTRWRLAAAGACLVLAAASKETWVVTPALVWVLERFGRGRTGRAALRPALAVAMLAAAYVVAYFLAFPGDKGYFSRDLAVLAKIPHMFAAFLQLETLVPLRFPLDWKGGAALLLVGAAAVRAARSRSAAGVAGLALLVLPAVPTLFVPYLPTRYTAIPYAGFLLLAWTGLDSLARSAPTRLRQAAHLGVSAVAVLVLAAGALTARADLGDLRRVSDAHGELLREARLIAPTLPVGQPVIAVRAERDDPLRAIALSVRGLPKIFFPRPADPYGLADTAALFEWARADERLHAVPIPAWRDAGGARVTVLLHEAGRFTTVEADRTQAIRGAQDWAARGAPVKAFVLELLP